MRKRRTNESNWLGKESSATVRRNRSNGSFTTSYLKNGENDLFWFLVSRKDMSVKNTISVGVNSCLVFFEFPNRCTKKKLAIISMLIISYLRFTGNRET